MMRILSLCTSAGLWDRAWIEAGHEIVAGCEIAPHKRALYEAFCGGTHIVHDIADLPFEIHGEHFDGIIAGIPCQSRSTMRARHTPKFGDLLPQFLRVLDACTWDWCLAENVRALDIPGFKTVAMNAMHYAAPHQSRERWFTYSPNLRPPAPLFKGDVDSLIAYPIVMGRVYGPRRGALLQGWPHFAGLVGQFPCVNVQEALADGVPRGLADAWIRSIENDMDFEHFFRAAA